MIKQYFTRPGWYSILFIIFSCIIFSTAVSQTSESRHFKIEILSEGIYAAIHLPGGYAICNAGIVDLGNETLIFDTFLSPEAASDLFNISQELTGNPVKYVINSHYHNDHIRGNQVFTPSATIISTVLTRELIEERESVAILEEKEYAPQRLLAMREEYDNEKNHGKKEQMVMWVGYYEAMVRSHQNLITTLPDSTFEDSLTLKGSERTMQLLEFRDGHTPSDLVMYLPEEKILFTGDLVFIGMHPFLADGSPEELVRILEELKALPLKQLVPGHGEAGTSKDIDRMIEYIEKMNLTINSFLSQNEDTRDPSTIEIPEPFRKWLFPNFFQINLKFMLSRVQGKTPNIK